MPVEQLGVVVTITVKPDKIDEFVTTATATMIEPTQSVPGVIRYELWQDIDEPQRFTIIEEWDSPEAQSAHLASEWLQPVIAGLQPYAEEPFSMQQLRRTPA